MKEISLLKKGRMFKDKGLIFVGKSQTDNDFLEEVGKDLGWNVFKKTEFAGPSIVFDKEEDKELVEKLWQVYLAVRRGHWLWRREDRLCRRGSCSPPPPRW